MEKSPNRQYLSAVRRRQADETRRRIAEAARRLFPAQGFAGTTVEAIARAAGVATQTVYAVFGSKRGILADILERASFGSAYGLANQVLETPDPADRLRLAVRIVRKIYDAERAELELLRGAGMVDPELAAQERETEGVRFEVQAHVIAYLAESGRLRPDLDAAAARDILWALTGRDLYRMIVLERGWASDRYEGWLEGLVTAALVTPDAPPRSARSIKKSKRKG